MSEWVELAKGLANMSVGSVALFAIGFALGWILRNRTAKKAAGIKGNDLQKETESLRSELRYIVGAFGLRVVSGLVMTNAEKGAGLKDSQLAEIVKRYGAPEVDANDPVDSAG